MPRIIRASEMGFCMGVRRAVQMMEDEATPERPISSAGEIVHNPHVVDQLARVGVRQLPGPDDVEGDFGAVTAAGVGGGRVAITAHGVGERVLVDLERAGLDIVDTTCPVVTRAQRYAQKFVPRELARADLRRPGPQGGPRHHRLGLRHQVAHSKVSVIEHADLDHLRDVIETFPGGFPNKIGVMAQTTHRMDDFATFVSNLMSLQREANFEMHVVNTLCHATTGQQAAAAELAHEVDVMVVVGGRKSANTRHLREVCESEGARTFQVESSAELEPGWFEGADRIGLTAGASTPDSSIDEVEERLAALTGAH